MQFAVIKTGGKQYKVAVGDTLTVEKLPPSSDGTIIFDQVLLVASGDQVSFGTPTVSGAKVHAARVEEGRAKKLLVFRYKAKSNYRKKRGHRQPFSRVKIAKIDF